MSDNPYIKAYVDHVTAEQQQREEFLQRVIDEGLPKFVENCQVWLGEMWKECQIGEAQGKVTRGQDRVDFILPLKWEGMEGMISSGPWGREHPVNQNTMNLPRAALSLGYGETGREYKAFRVGFDLVNTHREENTGTLYSEMAGKPDPLNFGRYLLMALEYRDEYREAVAYCQEMERKKRVERLSWGIREAKDELKLAAALSRAVTEIPEEADFWETLAEACREEFEHQAAQRQEQAAWQQAWDAELRRLEQEAKAKFHPFTLYRVRYGAQAQTEFETGDMRFYESEDYALQPEPDADGWWPVLRWGEMTRIRVSNLIAVEEHQVSTPYQVPVGTLKHASVESETCQGMSVDYWDLSLVEG